MWLAKCAIIIKLLSVGLHLEGPFINKVKKGCHHEDLIRTSVSKEKVRDCYGDSLEGVKIITLAPDLEGALGTIAWLSKEHKDIQIAIG